MNKYYIYMFLILVGQSYGLQGMGKIKSFFGIGRTSSSCLKRNETYELTFGSQGKIITLGDGTELIDKGMGIQFEGIKPPQIPYVLSTPYDKDAFDVFLACVNELNKDVDKKGDVAWAYHETKRMYYQGNLNSKKVINPYDSAVSCLKSRVIGFLPQPNYAKKVISFFESHDKINGLLFKNNLKRLVSFGKNKKSYLDFWKKNLGSKPDSDISLNSVITSCGQPPDIASRNWLTQAVQKYCTLKQIPSIFEGKGIYYDKLPLIIQYASECNLPIIAQAAQDVYQSFDPQTDKPSCALIFRDPKVKDGKVYRYLSKKILEDEPELLGCVLNLDLAYHDSSWESFRNIECAYYSNNFTGTEIFMMPCDFPFIASCLSACKLDRLAQVINKVSEISEIDLTAGHQREYVSFFCREYITKIQKIPVDVAKIILPHEANKPATFWAQTINCDALTVDEKKLIYIAQEIKKVCDISIILRYPTLYTPFVFNDGHIEKVPADIAALILQKAPVGNLNVERIFGGSSSVAEKTVVFIGGDFDKQVFDLFVECIQQCYVFARDKDTQKNETEAQIGERLENFFTGLKDRILANGCLDRLGTFAKKCGFGIIERYAVEKPVKFSNTTVTLEFDKYLFTPELRPNGYVIQKIDVRTGQIIKLPVFEALLHDTNGVLNNLRIPFDYDQRGFNAFLTLAEDPSRVVHEVGLSQQQNVYIINLANYFGLTSVAEILTDQWVNSNPKKIDLLLNPQKLNTTIQNSGIDEATGIRKGFDRIKHELRTHIKDNRGLSRWRQPGALGLSPDEYNDLLRHVEFINTLKSISVALATTFLVSAAYLAGKIIFRPTTLDAPVKLAFEQQQRLLALDFELYDTDGVFKKLDDMYDIATLVLAIQNAEDRERFVTAVTDYETAFWDVYACILDKGYFYRPLNDFLDQEKDVISRLETCYQDLETAKNNGKKSMSSTKGECGFLATAGLAAACSALFYAKSDYMKKWGII